MLEEDVCIGDIYKIGDAIIQISQGRIPCSTITKRTGIPNLMKQMVKTGYTGFLCRVLEEGPVHSNSSISLIEKHSKLVSIMYANKVYFHHPKDIDGMKKILAVDELAGEWKEDLSKRLEKLANSLD